MAFEARQSEGSIFPQVGKAFGQNRTFFRSEMGKRTSSFRQQLNLGLDLLYPKRAPIKLQGNNYTPCEPLQPHEHGETVSTQCVEDYPWISSLHISLGEMLGRSRIPSCMGSNKKHRQAAIVNGGSFWVKEGAWKSRAEEMEGRMWFSTQGCLSSSAQRSAQRLCHCTAAKTLGWEGGLIQPALPTWSCCWGFFSDTWF